MQPFFLPVGEASIPAAHLFCVVHELDGFPKVVEPGAPSTPPRAAVLMVPAFGEEMNRSRRQVSLAARALARAGLTVLQVDLRGTGDSSGDFGDASWSDWLDDLEAAHRWLSQHTGCQPWLWGLRSGCLLANALAHRLRATHAGGSEPVRMLFWQPVADGKVHLNQLLRLVTAGGLVHGEQRKTLESLHREWSEGRSVEVAGYRLSAELAQGMGTANLRNLPQGSHILCFEAHASAPGLESMPSAGLQELQKRWRQDGCQVDVQLVEFPSFWQLYETPDASRLREATVAAMEARLPVPAGPSPQGSSPPRLDDESNASPTWSTDAEPPVLQEQAILINCREDRMLGVHARSDAGATSGSATGVQDVGFLLVVGGPQVRVGSHRQFALLARRLARSGFPTLRFDLRGMGDSEGQFAGFAAVDADIAAAIQALQQRSPTVGRVVLFGLCDGASAAMLYWQRQQDARVVGLCLLNPWARSAATEAETQVKHYYAQRLWSLEFWRKLASGKVRVLQSARELIAAIVRMGSPQAATETIANIAPFDQALSSDFLSLQRQALLAFPGSVALLLSGMDFTAKEFVLWARSVGLNWVDGAKDPPSAGPRERFDFPDADHTFSSAAHRAQAEACILQWVIKLAAAPQKH